MNLEQLYGENRRVYVNTIKRYVDCYDTAEDIVQDAFIKAYKSFPTYDPKKGRLKTWFNKVLFSVLWDHKRKEKRKPPLLDIDDFINLEVVVNNDGVLYLNKLRLVKNPLHKSVLSAYFVLGYTLDEICEMFDQKKDNVHKIIQRFKKGGVSNEA